VDISEEGILLGRSNARALSIDNVRFKRSDMYGGLPGRLRGSVDVITGHVPYVPFDEIDDLPAEVKDHEPIYTLTDSRDGMYLLRRAIMEGVPWLSPSGWLLLEVSEDLGPRLKRMYKRAGLEQIDVATDSDRLSIVVEGRKSRGAARLTR
jgi:methylase of polypeptide subunit release factors